VVRFVAEDALPEEQAWAMARTDDGDCYLFVKRCELRERVFERAWAAYNRLLKRYGPAA